MHNMKFLLSAEVPPTGNKVSVTYIRALLADQRQLGLYIAITVADRVHVALSRVISIRYSQ